MEAMKAMRIADVAEKYGLTADTLRYYERIGLIPPVSRSPGGIREYSPLDEKWVEFASCMRNAELPIETLVEYVSLFRQGDDTASRRKALLVEQREILAAKIEAMQRSLGVLDFKISHYDDFLADYERGLSVEGTEETDE